MSWQYNNAWKLKHKNAAGRLWRYLEANYQISRGYLEKLRKGKIKVLGPVCSNVINYRITSSAGRVIAKCSTTNCIDFRESA